MQLCEVMVAAAVFGLSAATGLQLTAGAGESQQRLGSRSELLARIDQDRLQLQARWQASAGAPMGPCSVVALGLAQSAEAISLDAPLQRQLRISADGQSLEVSWLSGADGQPLRRRLFTPAGLGLCSDTTEAGAAA
ncbi:MAG: hypothetical protein ACO289_10060 [Prochlorococcaceae cyanobacterium]|jgi:hypothetical protein|nr:hypothetical protein [Synechococcaceae bacterium WB4_1_0192]